MAIPTHLHLRDTRDKLIDLLGFGETYPLQDVTVSAWVKVPFGDPATISIEPGQPDVEYEIHKDGTRVDSTASWTGDKLELEILSITEDVTYRILGGKIRWKDPPRKVYLHQTVTVKVRFARSRLLITPPKWPRESGW